MHDRPDTRDESFYKPRDEVANPPTIKAADGIHVLRRFRVDAVVYAPTFAEAKARIEDAWFIDAAEVVDE